MKQHVTNLLFLCFAVSIGAQNSTEQLKMDMAFYGDILMNAAATEHRTRANDSLILRVDEFLASPNSFADSLSDVPWLSVVGDEKGTFRILTWQVNRDDASFEYEGRLQLNSGRSIVLNDNKTSLEPLYATGDAEDWYGARYTNIKSFKKNGLQAYLLFGFDAHSKFNRRKVADVLYFEDDEPKFGLPVFAKDDKNIERYGKYRIILTYSLDIRISLDYDEKLDMVVHDHLVPFQGRFPGQGETYVGDGSYEAYKMDDDGNWIYVEKVFHDTQLEPINDGIDRKSQPKRDIFGRSKE